MIFLILKLKPIKKLIFIYNDKNNKISYDRLYNK